MQAWLRRHAGVAARSGREATQRGYALDLVLKVLRMKLPPFPWATVLLSAMFSVNLAVWLLRGAGLGELGLDAPREEPRVAKPTSRIPCAGPVRWLSLRRRTALDEC